MSFNLTEAFCADVYNGRQNLNSLNAAPPLLCLHSAYWSLNFSEWQKGKYLSISDLLCFFMETSFPNSHLIYSSTNYRMECIWFFSPILNLIKKRKEKKICNKLRLVGNKVQHTECDRKILWWNRPFNSCGTINRLYYTQKEKGPTCSYTWNTIYCFFLLNRLINVLPMTWYCACRHISCIWATREMRFPHHPFTQTCYKMSLAGYKSSIMAPPETCFYDAWIYLL